MKRIPIHLATVGALLCGAFSLGAQGTPADSVDYRCIVARFDTLTTANGIGQRRNLATAGKACASRWIARVRPVRVDTVKVTVHDTVVVVRVDTVYVSAPVDTTPPPPVDSSPIIITESVAELPRTYLRDAYPLATRIVPVPASASLQAALDTARAGDEIQLAQGTVYRVNLTWQRCLAGYVTITTQGIVLPNGTRPTPTVALQFAKLVSPNTSPALLAKNGGCRLWLSRLEVTTTATSPTVNYNYGIVRLGDGETTVETQPSDIVLERLYLHGSDSTQIQNAVIGNGRRLTLRDSRVDHVRWKGIESHCFAAYSGVGPFRIENNHLQCAGIGVLFGGAARKVPGMGPSDIEVTHNYFTKDSSYIGYVAKNLFELKDARRVLFEANVVEHSYFGAQTGMAINIQSLTDENDTTVQTNDVTVRWNRIRFASQCMMLSGHGYNGVARVLARVVIENNLCTDIGDDSLSRVMTISGGPQQIEFRHNTFVRVLLVRQMAVIPDGVGASGFVFENNVYGFGQAYGCVFRSGGATGAAAWLAFDPTAKVAGNVCWANGGSKTPTADFFPATQADVGFAADWSLTDASAYKGKATDGKDPGADVAELTRRTAGVVIP